MYCVSIKRWPTCRYRCLLREEITGCFIRVLLNFTGFVEINVFDMYWNAFMGIEFFFVVIIYNVCGYNVFIFYFLLFSGKFPTTHPICVNDSMCKCFMFNWSSQVWFVLTTLLLIYCGFTMYIVPGVDIIMRLRIHYNRYK